MEAGPEKPAADSDRRHASREPTRGGNIRIRLDGQWGSDPAWPPSDLGRFVVAATSVGLVTRGPDGGIGPGVARRWGIESGTGRLEWWFETDPSATFSDGRVVEPGDVVRSLTAAVAGDSSPGRWLLAPVAGATAFATGAAFSIRGLRVEDHTVRISLAHEAPDLLERLAHPSLRITSGTSAGSPPPGVGPFRIEDRGLLIAERQTADGPYLDRVELVGSASADSFLLARLGEIDTAVVYGRAVSRFADDPEHRFRLSALPAWDRTYFLWLDGSRRWTRDPAFRRWLGTHIDRTAMLQYLFDGRGRWPCDLLFRCGEDLEAVETAPTPWKVPPGLRPRIRLAFDASDGLATEIAARIKADLRSEGVEIDLSPTPPGKLARGGGPDLDPVAGNAVLLSSRSWTADPVLTLLGTLRSVPAEGLEAAIGELSRGSREPLESQRRESTATKVQKRVLDDARIVPVVRVDAFLVAAPGLIIAPGASDSLNVARAGWSP